LLPDTVFVSAAFFRLSSYFVALIMRLLCLLIFLDGQENFLGFSYLFCEGFIFKRNAPVKALKGSFCSQQIIVAKAR